MARHLVTGGSGFLGNLIARRLLEDGEEVRVLDVWRDYTQPTEIQFFESDIRDFDKVSKAMKGCDFVHHNVALVPLTKSGKDFWEVNVKGSEIAADAAKKNNVSHFIHMSSSAIFGSPKNFPINQETVPSPIEIYGQAKLAGEKAVRKSLSPTDLNLVIIRPRTILGPGRLGIFQVLFQWIFEERNVYTIGKGDNLFQFVHAHDLMDAYMLAIRQNRTLELNVGTETFGTLRNALQNLIEYANSHSKVIPLPVLPSIAALKIADKLKISPLAPWHYLTYHKPFYFDLQPLKSIGWSSQYSNDEMLSEAFRGFIELKGSNLQNESPHRKSISGGVLNLLKKLS